ncbi:nuclease-related domain-containing protein, partial [uncultured Ruminococcus sp.]
MLFQKNFGPIVLKEDGELSKQIDAVKQQIDMASEPEKIKLKSQLKLLQEGETGEKNILFELKNSGIDMYILHDIRLEDGDRSAQIDFLVVTRKLIFVIESKHLIGDIEIDENNGFIRSYEYYGKKVREGFYSPVTQNQRHLQLIHDVVMNHKKNAIMRLAFDHWFSDYYQSLVVLAN